MDIFWNYTFLVVVKIGGPCTWSIKGGPWTRSIFDGPGLHGEGPWARGPCFVLSQSLPIQPVLRGSSFKFLEICVKS